MAAVDGWLDCGGDAPAPPRQQLAAAVRLSLRTLAQLAPGGSVEVRVPPYAVVQCLAGPRHTRGTPPNVVQAPPRAWLLLATGRLTWADAVHGGQLSVSGTRAAEIAAWLPLTAPQPPATPRPPQRPG